MDKNLARKSLSKLFFGHLAILVLKKEEIPPQGGRTIEFL